jgi:hypothetical protein
MRFIVWEYTLAPIVTVIAAYNHLTILSTELGLVTSDAVEYHMPSQILTKLLITHRELLHHISNHHLIEI